MGVNYIFVLTKRTIYGNFNQSSNRVGNSS